MKHLHTFLFLAVSLFFLLPSSAASRQMESLGRGLVAVRQDSSHVVLSWRFLPNDRKNVKFNLFRDGKRINAKPLTGATFYVDDYDASAEACYEVRPTKKGADGRYTLPRNAPIGYIDIPLDRPADGTTPDGRSYSYNANDASVGDVDGDGEYEIILKWDPSNAKDNAHDGYAGNVLFDCYRLTGEHLWRIDLGRNIRAGAHYTQFMVYDLDGDGCAEVVMKTSDGTIDGVGTVIGDSAADYRHAGDTLTRAQEMVQDSIDAANMRAREARFREQLKQDSARLVQEGWTFGPDGIVPPGMDGKARRDWLAQQNRNRQPRRRTPPRQGRVLTGNEYLTVFSGRTGAALCTIPYEPARGDLAAWGDTKANRSDRYLACVAYLDGQHPSVVMCRGYYTRATLAAYDWDGHELHRRWLFDSDSSDTNRAYRGQGNHNLRVGDIDGDGCDEIVYGSCAIDHDGTGLYSTRLGHGDAMHLAAFIPGDKRLYVWQSHENAPNGSTFREAATGKILFQIPSKEDVGRCMAADIDPTQPGMEMWSSDSHGIRNIRGEVVADHVEGLSTNMASWWDGDLLRELLDGVRISKYDWKEKRCQVLFAPEGVERNNGTKSNPCLSADIVGDWREELLARTRDNSALRLYVSPIGTTHRIVTLMNDPVYRLSVATQNVAYNQPTQLGYWIGER